jgi:hypothetical protein
MWAFRLEDSPSGHSLQVLAEAAPGFPLLSLTRNGDEATIGSRRHHQQSV